MSGESEVIEMIEDLKEIYTGGNSYDVELLEEIVGNLKRVKAGAYDDGIKAYELESEELYELILISSDVCIYTLKSGSDFTVDYYVEGNISDLIFDMELAIEEYEGWEN